MTRPMWCSTSRIVTPCSLPDGPDQPGERLDLFVVQPRRRLVEQEEPGRAGERPGKLDPLERAEREAGGRMRGHRLEPEERHQLVRPRPDPRFLASHGRKAEGARAKLPRDRQCTPTMTFCRTERLGNRARFWNVRLMPSAEIRCAGTPSSGRPSNSSGPRSGV